MAPDEQKFNQDELVPPSFLNEKYILDMLISIEKDPGLHLINYETKPGSAAGDHYASIMFKIIATYGTSRGETVTDRRFILKTMPESGEKKEMLSKLPVFENEISMYTKTLPAMEKILSQHSEKTWWPKCVFSSQEPQVIVFDDLTKENYQVIYTQLDLKSIQIAIEHIAKYHALSMVLAETDKRAEIVKYTNSFNAENARDLFNKVTRSIKLLATAVKTWKGFEHIGEKLVNIEEKMLTNFLNCYTKENTWGYNVLNHGDFHIRNLMFKKDQQGNLTDIMFLDFQLPLYKSPAIDLHYMFNCIGDNEVREKDGEVIKMYHKELVSNLEKYGYKGKVPSLIDVLAELLHMSDYDAFQKLCFLPVMLIDFTGIEMSEILKDGEDNPITAKMVELFYEPKFVEHYKKLLYTLDNKGVFD